MIQVDRQERKVKNKAGRDESRERQKDNIEIDSKDTPPYENRKGWIKRERERCVRSVDRVK